MTQSGKGGVRVGDDSRARYDKSDLDGRKIDGGEVDGSEVKDDKNRKKVQKMSKSKNLFKFKKLSKSKNMVRTSDFLTLEAKLAFSKLK